MGDISHWVALGVSVIALVYSIWRGTIVSAQERERRRIEDTDVYDKRYVSTDSGSEIRRRIDKAEEELKFHSTKLEKLTDLIVAGFKETQANISGVEKTVERMLGRLDK